MKTDRCLKSLVCIHCLFLEWLDPFIHKNYLFHSLLPLFPGENSWQDHVNELRETLRWSYGAGVVLRLGRIARFELNYVIPQTALATDR